MFIKNGNRIINTERVIAIELKDTHDCACAKEGKMAVISFLLTYGTDIAAFTTMEEAKKMFNGLFEAMEHGMETYIVSG